MDYKILSVLAYGRYDRILQTGTGVPMYCTECGQPTVPDTAKFCASCGRATLQSSALGTSAGDGPTSMPRAGTAIPSATPPVTTGTGGAVTPRNGFGLAALILGIASIVLLLLVKTGGVLGILALIFGILGLQRVKRGEATNKGFAIAGIALGATAIGLVLLLAVANATKT